MIQKSFGKRQWAVLKLRSGLCSSKRNTHQQRMVNVQGGPPQVGTNCWLSAFCCAGITIREPSDKLGLSFCSVQSLLTEDLGMKCVTVKFFPKLLTVEQKETRLVVARNLLQCADQDANFIKTMITSDVSWVCEYDPEIKAQSSQRTTPRPKKARQF